MISVQNRLPRLSGVGMCFSFWTCVWVAYRKHTSTRPNEDYRTHFLIHKVRKGDTSFSLTKRYEISAQQLLYYNPELKDGLKRKMKLKIPRYKEIPPHRTRTPSQYPHSQRNALACGLSIRDYPRRTQSEQIRHGCSLSINQVLVIPEAIVKANSFAPITTTTR